MMTSSDEETIITPAAQQQHEEEDPPPKLPEYERNIIEEGVTGMTLSNTPPRGSDCIVSCKTVKLSDESQIIEDLQHVPARLGEPETPLLWDVVLPQMLWGEVCDVITNTERSRFTMHSWSNVRMVTHDKLVSKDVYVSAENPIDKPSVWAIVDCEYVVKNPHDGQVLLEHNGPVQLRHDPDLIWGVEETLHGMGAGEKAVVQIRPPYCYGYDGELEVNIEVRSWTEPYNDTFRASDEELLKLCEQCKGMAGLYYKKGDCGRAAYMYDHALELINDPNVMASSPKATELKTKLYCNLATVAMKNDKSAVIEFCTAALAVDATNSKALLMRGRTYLERNDFDLADADLKRIRDPSESVKRMLEYIVRQKNRHAKREKQMYAHIFDS